MDVFRFNVLIYMVGVNEINFFVIKTQNGLIFYTDISGIFISPNNIKGILIYLNYLTYKSMVGSILI